jgi:D-alanyl-D-alanine carboxypeptidase (penicillin-binding protein 5/6)
MKKLSLSFCFAFAAISICFAQFKSLPPYLIPYLESAPDIVSRAAVMVDIETGMIIYSKNPNDEIPPASLTKLMTMHLIMNEIDKGNASYDEIIPVTDESWAKNFDRRATLMALEPRHIVNIRELMLGLAIISGNDAAVALALRFAPSVDEFAAMMTEEAQRMGLSATRFVEPSGLSEENMTTAAEFTYFCIQYLKQHPNSIKDFHSVPVFNFPMPQNYPPALRGSARPLAQYNRNDLIRTFPGVDGLKTGYIDESGYNIAITAQRGNTRFVLVVLGAPAQPGGARIRSEDSMKLLTWAFDNFKTVNPAINKVNNVRLWKGMEKEASLVLADSVEFTSPVSRANQMWYEISLPQPLVAPLAAGTPVGHLVLYDEYGELYRVPLLTARRYERANVFKRFVHSFVLLFKK